ncbi:MAG: Glycosyltransferase Gtf1 [Elusimicrobia bacterium]|nr:Glycosyltransferase Gtf1 [Elusimicrobiota bacterium]
MRPLIRIAFVIDFIEDHMGGTEKQLLETLKRLDRKIYQPLLICLTSTPWVDSNKHEFSCPVVILGYRGFLKGNFFLVLSRLRKVLREHDINIVQTFFEDSIFLVFFATRLFSPKPILLASKRDIGLGKNQPWYHLLFGMIRPYVLRRFNGVVANSERVRVHVIKEDRLAPTLVHTIYNGIDIKVSGSRTPANASSLRVALVANFIPIKRHEVALEALLKLKKIAPTLNIQLYFYGKGPSLEDIRSRVEKEGLENQVHFEGAVTDVSARLGQMDVGLLCSDREGLSNSIMEYMVHGLPVVATSVGGNPELVDSTNGFLVPPSDPEALAKALLILAENQPLRLSMGKKSREKIETEFSWEKTLKKMESLYKETLRYPINERTFAWDLRWWVRWFLAVFLYRSGLLAFLNLLWQGKNRTWLQVITYHGISNRPNFIELFMPPALFWEQMLFLKKKFQLLTMTEVSDVIEGKITLQKPGICITLDDGYVDNKTALMPLAREEKIPFIVYLSTHSIDTQQPTLAEYLHRIIEATSKSSLDLTSVGLGLIPLSSFFDRAAAMKKLDRYGKKLDAGSREKFIDDVLFAAGLDRSHETFQKTMLGWDDVRDLSQAGVNFGAHSVSHPIMSRLNATEQLKELHESRERIEKEINRPVEHFAYPYGGRQNVNPELFETTKKSGYRTAVVLYKTPYTQDQLFALGRRLITIPVVAAPWGAFSPSLFSCELSGIFDFIFLRK